MNLIAIRVLLLILINCFFFQISARCSDSTNFHSKRTTLILEIDGFMGVSVIKAIYKSNSIINGLWGPGGGAKVSIERTLLATQARDELNARIGFQYYNTIGTPITIASPTQNNPDGALVVGYYRPNVHGFAGELSQIINVRGNRLKFSLGGDYHWYPKFFNDPLTKSQIGGKRNYNLNYQVSIGYVPRIKRIESIEIFLRQAVERHHILNLGVSTSIFIL